MGKNKKERTEELRRFARNYTIQSEVQSQIQEHNFRKLLAAGIIVEEK